MPRVKVMEGLDIISPYPAAFLPKSNSLVVSDTHFGIETVLASRGIDIPESVFKRTLDSVLVPAGETNCKKVYILGDLIHSHRKPGESEWWAVRRFADEIRAVGAEPVLVRGNHDRRVASMLRNLGISYHQRYVRVDHFILTHGHKKVMIGDEKRIDAIIMGHEHPAVSIRNEFGGKGERFKAFFLVKRKKIEPPLFVLPSVNPLAFGTDIGDTSQRFLSPYLKGVESKDVQPFVLEVGDLLLRFPSLASLQT